VVRSMMLAGCGLLLAATAATAETPFHYTAPLPPPEPQAVPAAPPRADAPLSQADRLRAVIGNPENCPPEARPHQPESGV
jgi:hypothetical protein